MQELKHKCDQLEGKCSSHDDECAHLRRCIQDRDRCIATGRTDGTGTDYPAALAQARKDRGDLNRRCKKLETALTNVCNAAANARCKREHEDTEQCKKIASLECLL